jgi:hypothetical protein
MCIIRFHARVGYMQTYETLLKEINAHPGSAHVPGADNQYQVECLALADRNMNIPCESGIRYPSLTAMLNRRDMYWRITVQFQFNLACTMYVQCMYNVCNLKNNIKPCVPSMYNVCTLNFVLEAGKLTKLDRQCMP